eukprot:Hpha_TRINITY_DN34339_c0_g1::TRINITY_DN34339_c0_g1_i1::g.109614::m.109614
MALPLSLLFAGFGAQGSFRAFVSRYRLYGCSDLDGSGPDWGIEMSIWNDVDTTPVSSGCIFEANAPGDVDVSGTWCDKTTMGLVTRVWVSFKNVEDDDGSGDCATPVLGDQCVNNEKVCSLLLAPSSTGTVECTNSADGSVYLTYEHQTAAPSAAPSLAPSQPPSAPSSSPIFNPTLPPTRNPS